MEEKKILGRDSELPRSLYCTNLLEALQREVGQSAAAGGGEKREEISKERQGEKTS